MAKASTTTPFDLSQFGNFDVGFADMDLTEEALPSLHCMPAGEAQIQCTKVELTKTSDQSKYPGAPRANFFFAILTENDVWPIKAGFNIPHAQMDDNAKSTAGRQLRDHCVGMGVRVENVSDFLEALQANMFVGITKWSRIRYTPADGNWNEKNELGGFMKDR